MRRDAYWRPRLNRTLICIIKNDNLHEKDANRRPYA